MSRYCGEDRDAKPCLDAADHWRQQALLSNGSVFSDTSLWQLAHLEALDRYFINQLDDGAGNFFEKFECQLKPTTPEVKQLAAEMLWMMLVYPSGLRPGKKRDNIANVWNWSGEPLPESPWLSDTVLTGIGSAGTSYNINRWRELVFFIRLMIDFKNLTSTEREQLLSDG